MSNSTLDYLFNHIFLPQRLPHANDLGNGSGDQALADLVLQSLLNFRDANRTHYYQELTTIVRALRSFCALHRHNGSLSRDSIRVALRDIRDGGILIFHIALQNSGLIIRKTNDRYLIESFEASPPAATVLSAHRALQWDFPSRAVTVLATAFEDASFQASFAEFLEKASVEPVKQFAATTLKAGSLAYESRDTTAPSIVGQLLMSLLEANGHQHQPTLTRKRVYDELCWNDGAENPWRRSPQWLVLRVSLQRSLCFLFGGELGTLFYKVLICSLMASVGKNLCTTDPVNPTRLAFARSKIARRLAKLQKQREIFTREKAEAMASLLSNHEKAIESVVGLINDALQTMWKSIRGQTVKHVLPLPKRADPSSTTLSLYHSRGPLLQILEEALYGRPPTQIRLESRFRNASLQSQNAEVYRARSIIDYMNLADFEVDLKCTLEQSLRQGPQDDLGALCSDLRNRFQHYLYAIPAYRSNPEQMSLMLITIMELFKTLDSSATTLFPLLAQYDLGLPHDLLHFLQVPRLEDMQRLQNVEEYFDTRRSNADLHLPPIFGETLPESFGVRFFNQYPPMQDLMDILKQEDENARVRKKAEWRQKSREYEQIMREAAATACLFIEDEFNPFLRQHDDHRCRKHCLERQANRMRIEIHEAILPNEEHMSKAIIFELRLPQAMADWRDSLWKIRNLARQDTIPGCGPQVFLREYSGFTLHTKGDSPPSCNVTLASRTKSFLNTHFAKVPFPTTIDQVCLSHGLKYGLYDRAIGMWTSRSTTVPSFAELCAPSLPPKSLYGSLRKFLHPNFEGEVVTENAVVASQTRCPTTMNINEFLSFQYCRLGPDLQWITLLRELASSNLNFGTVEVGTLVTEIALLSGPPERQSGSPLRAIHWVFQDPKFCANLAQQIKKRLDRVAPNWREGQAVDTLTTLIVRLWSLTPLADARKGAEELLLYVRRLTIAWIRQLRGEICNAMDIDTAQKRSRDSLLAAMLSRRTFVIDAADPNRLIQSDGLACFFECAFTLKDNLPKNESNDLAKMPEHVKNMFIADIKLVHRLERQLKRSIDAFPEAVGQAINHVWADAGGSLSRQFSSWEFLPALHSGWMTATTALQDGLFQQNIHVDILEGTLLIDGRPLGRLPEEFTRQGIFQQLFENRVFLTRPSSIFGMSYMLASLFKGHEIHFGFRRAIPFVRVRKDGKILELIPSQIFLSGSDAPDLPLPLINDCVHWLDLASWTLEVRPCVSMWSEKYSNWKIDLRTNTAVRRQSRLVDPRSSTFTRVACLVEPFEGRSRMVIFQPERSNMTLHLPALELQFRVNHQGLLESQQLRAVVDLNQDAGTFYGLKSCLVLKDILVPEDRSIIVAMGPAALSAKSVSDHVSVQISHTGYYARFSINEELGRLECQAEPRLLYFKAYCHGVTGYLLPDPLTRRTGTDEALSCLQAANAQPWTSLDQESYRILRSISELTPQRSYYPEKLKILQRITWDQLLLPDIQHDFFRPIIQGILHQCKLLHHFHIGSEVPPNVSRNSDEHLLDRAVSRNQLHRANQHKANVVANPDQIYIPRDLVKSISCKNTLEAVTLVKNWSAHIEVSRDLTAVLRDWPTIQGYSNEFGLYLLADLIDVDFASYWGSLARLCIRSSEADKSKFMFLFATIAFNARMDMSVIRSLIAMVIVTEFKTLELPRASEFKYFQGTQAPTIGFLMQLMKPYCVPYPEDERSLLDVPMHPKQKRKLELAQREHEEESCHNCRTFAEILLSQWPCREPLVKGEDEFALLDAAKAFLAIKPEWERLFHNHELSKHMSQVQKILDICHGHENMPTHTIHSNVQGERDFFPNSNGSDTQMTLKGLLQKSTVLAQPASVVSDDRALMAKYARLNTGLISKFQTKDSIIKPSPTPGASGVPLTPTAELKAIVSSFACSSDHIRQNYGRDLQRSITAFENCKAPSSNSMLHINNQEDMRTINETISLYRSAVQERFREIRDFFIQHDHTLNSGGLLPDLTSTTILAILPTLRRDGVIFEAILHYAQLITHLQRLLRIRNAQLRQDRIQLSAELGNSGIKDWYLRDHIDWLLLQIDFNLLIRQDQFEVARAMIAPKNGINSVLQMNMGLGKSSVIIPMIAAKLADGKRLVRVVVPRPLLLQTAQLLQSRLGGLIGRKVKHIPFSRKSSTDMASLKTFYNLHAKTLQDRGVILTLPEHMLSFHLSGLQELSNGHLQQADFMLKVRSWLDGKSRNVLDECDHMLAVKTQLIYPSGSQSMVDGHPSRWTVVQDLLKLVIPLLGTVRYQFPQGIEVIERGTGSFPTIYLLNQDVKTVLFNRLTENVVSGVEGILPIDRCSLDELMTIKEFLRKATFPKSTASQVATIFKNNLDARQRLLLLRGLLVHRILLMGLSKRWNVQYGIDPRRDPIAVPFRSKGIPSDQAEFGHPDVSILLTCLSFYYAGLTFPQFQQTLRQLLKSDEPIREYESWMQCVPRFPEALSSWSSINVEDEAQCAQLWAHFSRQMTVINYFLNHFVFPRHARTFERKLVSSGWDIATQALTAVQGSLGVAKENVPPGNTTAKSVQKSSNALTVGFSGTNDNKTLLPMNVVQDDLPELSQTNAEVLTYLLQPRNKHFHQTCDFQGKRLSERDFLQRICNMKIRMLLDAGAQIIELDNLSLARTWLFVDNEAEAAVFFGEDGRARVLYRDGKQQPLAASPFLNNLGSCVVYLDEVCSEKQRNTPSLSMRSLR